MFLGTFSHKNEEKKSGDKILHCQKPTLNFLTADEVSRGLSNWLHKTSQRKSQFASEFGLRDIKHLGPWGLKNLNRDFSGSSSKHRSRNVSLSFFSSVFLFPWFFFLAGDSFGLLGCFLLIFQMFKELQGQKIPFRR